MNKKGFSIIEVMIILAVLALLAAIAIPNFQQAKANVELEEKRRLNGQQNQISENSLTGFFRRLFQYPVPSQQARFEARQNDQKLVQAVEFEGHQYLITEEDGITHSESCLNTSHLK